MLRGRLFGRSSVDRAAQSGFTPSNYWWSIAIVGILVAIRLGISE
jgi:hypothetical protein